MEDAWVLAKCLELRAADVVAALDLYNTARVDRTAQIMLRARSRSELTHGRSPAHTQAWYQELAQETGQRVSGDRQNYPRRRGNGTRLIRK